MHPDAVLRGPLYIGDYAKVESGAEIREHTVSARTSSSRAAPSCTRPSSTTTCTSASTATSAAASSARTPTSCGPPGSRTARHRGRVPDRRRIDRAGQRPRLPVQDHRGRRVRQHLGDLGVPGPGAPLRRPRGVRHPERGDHARAGRTPRRRLRDHAQEGLHGHHRPRSLPSARRSSGRSSPRSRPAPSTYATWRTCRCRWPGSRPRGAAPAAS